MDGAARYAYARQFPQPGADALPPAELAAKPATKPADPTAPAATPPASVTADGKLRVGKEGEAVFELDATDIQNLLTEKSARELRATQVPADASLYTLPPNELDGVKFEWNANDPALLDFRNWAFKAGLTNEQFGQALGLYVRRALEENRQFQTQLAAEREKLGTAAASRVDTVATFIRGRLGEDGARALLPMLVTSAAVQSFERLISQFCSQGSGSFNTNLKEPPSGAQKVTDEQWAKMSSAERLDYARGFDQSQFR
jgi:hypothetical protein